MKRLILLIVICISSNIYSQTIQDILSPKQMTITWLGVDFTHGKYLLALPGKVENYLPDYCIRVNKTIAENHSRYYFPIAYRKDFVYNTKVIDSVNNNIDKSVLVEKRKELLRFDATKIKQIVSEYEFPETMKGVGLIYIYESFSQSGNDEGTIWMAFINIETKEILFLQNTTSGIEGKTIEENLAYPVLSMLRKSKGDYEKWCANPEKFNLINQ